MNAAVRKLDPLEDLPFHLLLLADPSIDLVTEYARRGDCFITELDGKTIGTYVLLPTRPGTAELVNVAVDEAYRNRGLGKQLVLHAIDEARTREYKTIEIGTSTTSKLQIALYRKCGFHITYIDEGFFIRHYDEPIFENGLRVQDMVRMALYIE